MFLFADDSTLSYNYSDPRTAEIIINNDLEQIAIHLSKWSKQWHLEFNPSKTIFINFSLLKKRDALNIAFNQVTEHKHLGIFQNRDTSMERPYSPLHWNSK